MRRFFCFLTFFLLASFICFAQQADIAQFSFVAGPTYFHTPSLNLATRGFNGDFAQNVRPWLTLGFDFSTSSGHNTIIPSYLSSAAQTKLGQMLAPMHIPLSAVAVPTDVSVTTYQAGPQVNYRHFKKVTFVARPALGLLHAKIQTHPSGAAAPLVNALLGGKLSDADTAVFYGFGGGATWEIHRNFGLRFAADFARYNFFGQQLNGPRNSLRLTVATKFSFGKNIVRK